MRLDHIILGRFLFGDAVRRPMRELFGHGVSEFSKCFNLRPARNRFEKTNEKEHGCLKIAEKHKKPITLMLRALNQRDA